MTNKMCTHCKKQSREFTVELTHVHNNRHNRTGCDLYDHDPVFTFGGEPLPFDRHAVNYDWMRKSLDPSAMNKMLYHLSSSDDVELFGAVYDSIAYLFVVRVNDSIPNPNPEPEKRYRLLEPHERATYGDEYLHGGQWKPMMFVAGDVRVGRYAGYYRRPLNDSIPNPEPAKPEPATALLQEWMDVLGIELRANENGLTCEESAPIHRRKLAVITATRNFLHEES